MKWANHRLAFFLGAISLVVAACTAAPGAVEGPDSTDPTASTVTTVAGGNEDGNCPESGGTPWESGPEATASVVTEAGTSGASVALVRYPRPEYDAKVWSQWGQGVVLEDGRFISALGDHEGADGNSFIYEYDPASMTLTQIVDVLATVPHEPGDWGFGKIHAQMVVGNCGNVFVATYWGSRRDLAFTDGYQGDILLRLDPESRTTTDMGVILPEHGVASMAISPDGSLIYTEPADPIGQKVGYFLVTDSSTGDEVFSDASANHGGYRNIAVGPDGSAYITWNGNGLAKYDPATNELTETDITMPGELLRASTAPDSSGTVFAVSRDPAIFFSLAPDGSINELGPASGYTASMALSPDGSRFYYVPDAHGGSWEQGTPLIAVDTATGESEVVVELNPLVEAEFGLVAGGTYNVAVSGDGKTVYVGLNAGDPSTRDTFGEVILAIVTLP